MEAKHFNNDGAEYFQLHIGCPVCIEHQIPTKPTFWVHGRAQNGLDCGGDIYIGDNGFYYCERCHEKDLIVNWAYKCPNPIHGANGADEYLSISDGKYLANALIVAGEITVGPGGLKWLNRLTTALMDQKFGSK